jgi:hypothetical protein
MLVIALGIIMIGAAYALALLSVFEPVTEDGAAELLLPLPLPLLGFRICSLNTLRANDMSYRIRYHIG